jgi:hypothetical protein
VGRRLETVDLELGMSEVLDSKVEDTVGVGVAQEQDRSPSLNLREMDHLDLCKSPMLLMDKKAHLKEQEKKGAKEKWKNIVIALHHFMHWMTEKRCHILSKAQIEPVCFKNMQNQQNNLSSPHWNSTFGPNSEI